MSQIKDSAAIEVVAKEVLDDPNIKELHSIVTIDKGVEVAKFDPIKAQASELVKEIQSTVYDIATSEGEDTAKALRRRCVTMRTSADAVYKTWNRPVLDAQNEMRAIVAGIVKLVEPVEQELDAAIKAKEKAREDTRLAKVAAEQSRIAVLRAKITSIAGFPAAAARATSSSEIQALLGTLEDYALDDETFEEFRDEATVLHCEIYAQLVDMLGSAQSREAQAAQLAAQALALQAEREAQAVVSKRAAAILEIRGYPIKGWGFTSAALQYLLVGLTAITPTIETFGDAMDEAFIAHKNASHQLRSMMESALAAEAAEFQASVERVAFEKRQSELSAAVEQRQREATASAVLLKNQQDAFEEERRIAAAEIAAEKERMAVERKALQAQADALANPPAAVVAKAADDESTMPATPISDAVLGQAMAGVSEGYVDHAVAQLFAQVQIADTSDTSRDDLKAREILDNICYLGEPYLCGLDRLFNPGTHAALVRLHNTLKEEQLEEIPA